MTPSIASSRVTTGLSALRLPAPRVLEAVRRDGELRLTGDQAEHFGHRLKTCDGKGDDGIHGGWSVEQGAVVAYTDRYGLWPIFYHCDGTRLILSDSILGVVSRMPRMELDGRAIGVFLSLGFYLGESTPFRDIRVLPPGGTLRWDGLDAVVAGERPRSEPRDMSFDDAVDAYIESFRTSIRRRLEAFGPPAAMLLSGGRDSRRILLELERQGARPNVCATVGRPNKGLADPDVVIAAAVSQGLNIPHTAIRMGGLMSSWLRPVRRATHYLTDEHLWVGPAFAWLAARTAVSFDGIAGTSLATGDLGMPDIHSLIERGTYEAAAASMVARYRSYDPKKNPQNRRAAALLGIEFEEDTIVGTIADEIRAVASSTDPVVSFYFWNRTRREIALAPYGLGRGVAAMFAPYLDRDLFDLLQSVPSEHKWGGRLLTAAIERAYPTTSAIPFADQSLQKNRWTPRRFASAASAYTQTTIRALRAHWPLRDVLALPSWLRPYALDLDTLGRAGQGTD